MNRVLKAVRKTLDQQRVEEIFNSCSDPNNCYEYITLLFAEIDLDVRNGSPIVKLNGYPKVGKQLGDYIFSRAVKKDKQLIPQVISGGGWMNWGWSTTDEIGDWEVSTEGLHITVRDDNGQEKEVWL